MEIYREGKKIILTEQELFLAYKEQEDIYDMENVRENMETYLIKEQYPKFKENKKLEEREQSKTQESSEPKVIQFQ